MVVRVQLLESVLYHVSYEGSNLHEQKLTPLAMPPIVNNNLNKFELM